MPGSYAEDPEAELHAGPRRRSSGDAGARRSSAFASTAGVYPGYDGADLLRPAAVEADRERAYRSRRAAIPPHRACALDEYRGRRASKTSIPFHQSRDGASGLHRRRRCDTGFLEEHMDGGKSGDTGRRRTRSAESPRSPRQSQPTSAYTRFSAGRAVAPPPVVAGTLEGRFRLRLAPRRGRQVNYVVADEE